jgi:hypothetical protein
VAAHVDQNEMLGLSGTGPESLNKTQLGLKQRYGQSKCYRKILRAVDTPQIY